MKLEKEFFNLKMQVQPICRMHIQIKKNLKAMIKIIKLLKTKENT